LLENLTKTVHDSYEQGSVYGQEPTAGFCGYLETTKVQKCYSTGKVEGSVTTGFVGNVFNSEITDSYWEVETSEKTESK
jgi:hypothetical protein